MRGIRIAESGLRDVDCVECGVLCRPLRGLAHVPASVHGLTPVATSFRPLRGLAGSACKGMGG